MPELRGAPMNFGADSTIDKNGHLTLHGNVGMQFNFPPGSQLVVDPGNPNVAYVQLPDDGQTPAGFQASPEGFIYGTDMMPDPQVTAGENIENGNNNDTNKKP